MPSPTLMLNQYRTVRAFSEKICEPLIPEDYVIQSMPDVSPTKWHLAHTSWFFETFLLKPNLSDYKSLHPQYDFLFNSYYNTHRRTPLPPQTRPAVPPYGGRHLRLPRLCRRAHGTFANRGGREEKLRALEPLVDDWPAP